MSESDSERLVGAWIEHDGGPMPVKPGARVDLRWNLGEPFTYDYDVPAGEFEWERRDEGPNIAFYRPALAERAISDLAELEAFVSEAGRELEAIRGRCLRAGLTQAAQRLHEATLALGWEVADRRIRGKSTLRKPRARSFADRLLPA